MECRFKSWNRKNVWRDPRCIMGSLLEFRTGGSNWEKLLIQRSTSTIQPLYPLTHTQSENARVRGRGRNRLKVVKKGANVPSVPLCVPAGNGDSTCRPTHRHTRAAQPPRTPPTIGGRVQPSNQQPLSAERQAPPPPSDLI